MFKGADTGFVRLSPIGSVNEDVDAPGFKMNPSMALKFLRDSMDSGNISANHSFFGQSSYNFFENSVSTIVTDTDNISVLDTVHQHFKRASDFQGGLGNSEFASYEQDGTKVLEPVFPFRLRFEPTGDINMPADTYDESVFEFIGKIEPDQVLYRVMALAEPNSRLEKHIANIRITTQMHTSLWGDEHMYFRHTRMDDDIRLGKPEWAEHVFAILTDVDRFGTGEPTLKPQTVQHASSCPLSFLWS